MVDFTDMEPCVAPGASNREQKVPDCPHQEDTPQPLRARRWPVFILFLNKNKQFIGNGDSSILLLNFNKGGGRWLLSLLQALREHMLLPGKNAWLPKQLVQLSAWEITMESTTLPELGASGQARPLISQKQLQRPASEGLGELGLSLPQHLI